MKRVKILNYGIDLLSFNEALSCVEKAVEEAKNTQVVTINPEMIELATKNPEFSNVLNHAELVIPDGVGVKLALKFKGIKQEQIRGIDFARGLIALCAKKGYRLALLGAKEEVVQKVRENLLLEFPDLNIVFLQNGYFKDEEPVLNALKEASPQVLLCALGAPRQDVLIYKLKNILEGCAFVGVGGSFDVFAGVVDEAPLIWRKMRLEWLYRTLKQPERFKRIFPTLPLFLFRAILESMRGKND